MKIGVLGTGQLGSRHLQALAKLKGEAEIFAVDPSRDSLSVAQERFAQIAGDSSKIRAKFFTGITDLPETLDVLVVATNADHRLSSTQELLNKVKVKNIIFEKVLFQNRLDYFRMMRILNEKSISAWVNCARRMWPLYQDLKGFVRSTKGNSLRAIGGDWGLACNSIHILDCASFLFGDESFTYDISGLDPHIQPSKRKGYIELTGRLIAHGTRGTHVTLESTLASSAPFHLSFFGSEAQVVVDETNRRLWKRMELEDWVWKEERFETPYQSDLTNIAVEEIMNTGKCTLPTFEASTNLHLGLIEALLVHVNRCSNTISDSLPIT